jgi:hypothetical protein
VEGGGAEQDLDPAVEDIFRQAVPEMEHGGAAAVVGLDAGAAEFEQAAARGEEGGQVEFGFGIEAPGGGAAVGGQDAVGADDMGFGRGVDAAVDEEKVVEERVEGVTLQPAAWSTSGPSPPSSRTKTW